MIDYLSGALPWLRRRAELVLTNMQSLSIPPAIRPRIEAQIEELKSTINEISGLLDDPTLANPDYINEHSIRFRKLVRVVDDVEAIFLPLVERWGRDEERMQQLLTKLCQNANLLSLVQPVIALYSWEYFFVLEYLHVIYMPRLEGHFWLHLPDLYHEVGHVLLEQMHTVLWGEFQERIRDHFDRQYARAKLENIPLASTEVYSTLADSWRHWLIEFTSDIIATYLCGPAYGWSHLHLCASKGTTAYHPSVGEESSHPADEARWRVIALVLDDIGWRIEQQQIESRWRSLIHSIGESEPTYFRIAYPANLLKDLRQQVKQGLTSLNVSLYSKSLASQGNGQELADLLNQAWSKFWQAPSEYVSWEKETCQNDQQ